MDLKAFAKYIKHKPLSQLLHQARKESLKRIAAHEDMVSSARSKKRGLRLRENSSTKSS
jgi:hypothetical protein